VLAETNSSATVHLNARLIWPIRLLTTPRESPTSITRGCTEGLNLVLKGFLKSGDRVLVSPLEHNAVMRPLMRLSVIQRRAPTKSP
jgi:cysteine sulfinate desulfinase/cysteine desulfurase-like protein